MKQEIDINQIANILESSGISPLVKAEIGQTQAGRPRLTLTGAVKTVMSDEGSGLSRILEGDVGSFLSLLAKTIAIPGDLSSTQLLSREDVRSACVTEINLKNITRPLILTHRDDGKLPVFYGSTAGINFAEVLETALCGKFLQEKVDAKVYFDTDNRDSAESQAILIESVTMLPITLKEKINNFIQRNGQELFTARLMATLELLSQIEGIPEVEFSNIMTPFRLIKNQFTLGQLMLMAKAAGSDPKLFESKGQEIKVRDLIEKGVSQVNPFELLSKPVFDQFSTMGPSGFTFYAREARLGQLYSLAVPLKLTDKANIYKILLSMRSLYNDQTGLGITLMPISRMRILPRESRISTRPIDPVVLRIMSLEDPVGFQRLVTAFKDKFKVLSPDEAIKAGTGDIRFVATDFMKVEV